MTTQRFASLGLRVYRTGRTRAIVERVGPDPIVEIEDPLATVLTLCQSCRTLDEHAELVARVLPILDRHQARAAVQSLLDIGLLAPVDLTGEPTAAPIAGPISEQPGRRALTTVGIVTADRPRLLERCLTALVEDVRRFGRRPRLIVVDGSRGAPHRASNRHVVSTLARATGLAIQYVGHTEAAALRQRLSKAVSVRLTREALEPGDVGANRNLLLLMSAGEHLLMVDDDVVCRGWGEGDRANDVVVGGHDDLRLCRFFSNRQEALSVDDDSVDVLGDHERLLGRSLSALSVSAPVDLRFACHHLTSEVLQGRPLTVRLTQSGLAGDAGLYCPYYATLFSTGPARQLLLCDASAFATALSSREVRRVADRLVVSHEPHCMAYCLGVANDAPLPPFMPSGRNEDGVFGAMIAFAEPYSLCADLPHGVLHDSNRDSTYAVGEIPSASGTRLSDVLLSAVRQTLPSALSTVVGRRHEALIDTLTDLAALDVASFARWCRSMILDQRTRLLAHADGQAAACPPYWRAALDDYRRQFTRNVADPRFFVPRELHQPLLPDAYGSLQTWLRSYGQLMRVWPELWKSARAVDPNELGAIRDTRARDFRLR